MSEIIIFTVSVEDGRKTAHYSPESLEASPLRLIQPEAPERLEDLGVDITDIPEGSYAGTAEMTRGGDGYGVDLLGYQPTGTDPVRYEQILEKMRLDTLRWRWWVEELTDTLAQTGRPASQALVDEITEATLVSRAAVEALQREAKHDRRD